MPYAYRKPDIAFEHGGVAIYPVYKDGMADNPWDFWFTTDPETADECHAHGERGHFDVRMFAARWSQTPTIHQWDEFWEPRFRTEQDAIEALIRSAIDDGRIPRAVNPSAGE